jgi:hypothetical protein
LKKKLIKIEHKMNEEQTFCKKKMKSVHFCGNDREKTETNWTATNTGNNIVKWHFLFGPGDIGRSQIT